MNYRLAPSSALAGCGCGTGALGDAAPAPSAPNYMLLGALALGAFLLLRKKR